MMLTRRTVTVAAGGAAAAAALSLAGCGPTQAGLASGPTPLGAAGPRELIVFAAASLTETFHEIARAWEHAHPGLTVTLNFAGSQDLVTQIEAGAPADVFASASEGWMDTAVKAGLMTGEPVVFARNSLTIAVAPGNPKNVTGVRDIAQRTDLVSVRCASQVPCGALTDAVLEDAGVNPEFDAEQNSVKQTLGLLVTGEADVALVYGTDVAASAGKVDAVEIDGAAAYTTAYPISVTAEAAARGTEQLAQDFVNSVLGVDGQDVLTRAGFLPPEPARS